MSAVQQVLFSSGVPPWTPAQVAGLEAWWDASDNSTITQSLGLVVSWNDKTVNGRNWGQSNQAQRPAVSDPGTGYQNFNTLQGMAFDGNKTMNLASDFVYSTPKTILWTINWAVFGGNNQSFLYGGVPSIDGLGAGGSVAVAGNLNVGFDDATKVVRTNQGNISGLYQFTAQTDLTVEGTSFRKNGGAPGGTPVVVGSGPFGTLKLRNISSTDIYTGHYTVGEILIYNNILSVSDRNLVETYLKTKWGTP